MMCRLGYLLGKSVIAAMLAASALVPAPSTSAATGQSYTQPRWWAKYQHLAGTSSTPANPGAVNSVTVGANLDISNEPGPQSETSIAIDPANPKQVIAGSNEIDRLPMRGYYSSDGGASYTGVDLPLPPPLVTNGTDFGSDPGVAWDSKGNVYYSYIVVFFSHGNGTSINGTEMAVARTSDGGRTWTPTYFALQTGQAQFNDKPMIAVDTNLSSPYRDTIYVAWDNATGGNGKTSSSNGVLVSRSTDGGRTFSAPAYATDASSGPKSVIAADPFVAPDGTLYVAWDDLQNSRIAVSRSTDGGATFGSTSTIAPTQATYEVAVPAMSVRQALIYPACGVDASTGPRRGTLYCSWMDVAGPNGTDIFVAQAQAPGTNWGAPVRVNDDPAGAANDQFNQWLAVDPADGSVNMSWNDTRNDPSHLMTDIYFGRSVDGGATFAPNMRVTTAPTDETCCGAELFDQYGDYEGIAALGGTIRPVWTDRRASVAALDEEVFTATLTAKLGR